MFRIRQDEGSDQVRHRGRVVDLSANRLARRRSGAPRPPKPSRARRIRSLARPLWTWAKVALLAAAALIVIDGREELLRTPGLDWLSGLVERAPIRAAINVRSERADCQVARVIDGDTVDIDCDGEGLVRTRLMGYDTPEVYSPKCDAELALGNRATQALERHINGSREVHVAFRGTDRYGRRLAYLSLDGTDVAQPLIAAGLARPYEGGRRDGWCG
jgi:micrococcal nuclease